MEQIALYTGRGLIQLDYTRDELIDWYYREFKDRGCASRRMAADQLKSGLDLGITVSINGKDVYRRGRLLIADMVPVLS